MIGKCCKLLYTYSWIIFDSFIVNNNSNQALTPTCLINNEGLINKDAGKIFKRGGYEKLVYKGKRHFEGAIFLKN